MNLLLARENNLKAELRSLEADYLCLIKLHQKRESFKNKLKQLLNSCVEVLQKYGSEQTQTPSVKINRKDFSNLFKDLQLLSQKSSKYLQQVPEPTTSNKYLKSQSTDKLTLMASSNSASTLNVANIRLLDDKLMEMHQLSSHLRNAAKKLDCPHSQRTLTSIDNQISHLEKVMRETLQLNMLFLSYDLSKSDRLLYDSALSAAIDHHRNIDLQSAVSTQDLRLSDLQRELSASVDSLRVIRLAHEKELTNEREARVRLANLLAVFSNDLNEKVEPPLRRLADKFRPLERVASNSSLRVFLEECRLQMPLLRSFIDSCRRQDEYR